MRSSEYQRGYDAGYKQALLDALGKKQPDPLTIRLGDTSSPVVRERLRRNGLIP